MKLKLSLLLLSLWVGLCSNSVWACDFSLPEIVSYQKTGATSYTIVVKVCAGGGGQGADDATNYIGILLPTGATITSFSPANIENGATGATTIGTGSCTDCTGPLSGAVTSGRALEFSGDFFEDINTSGNKRRTCQDVTINFTSASDLSGQTIYVVGMEDATANPSLTFDILTDVNPIFTFTPSSGSSTGNCTDAALSCTYHCTFGLTLDTPTPQTDLYVVGGSSSYTSGVGDNPCTAFQVSASACGSAQYNVKNFRGATKTTTPSYAGTCGYATGAGNGSSSTQDDIWMAVTVPASGTLDIELFKTDKVGSNTIEDLAVAVYTGSPVCTSSGGLTLVDCNDDKYTRNYAAPNTGISVSSTTGYFMPHLTQTGLTVGSTVYIRIFDPTIAGAGNSDFYVAISDGVKPADNVCGSANTLSNSNVTYDTRYCRRSDLSSNIPYLVTTSTCGGSVENPIWFTFNSDATASTKDIQFNNINCSHSVYDPDNTPANNDGIQVYLLSNSSSTDCSGTWTNVACNSIGSGTWNTGSQTFTTPTLTSNTKYYIMVDGFAGDACIFDARLVGVACPTLASAPPAVSITNSTCTAACTPSGGSISAPTGTPCPAGSTLQYSTDSGTTWSTTLPTYAQTGPAQTILTRCNCDSDNTQSSPTATATTVPGTCTAPTAGITNNESPTTTVITCSNTAISVIATGGATYDWSGGATPATAANDFTAANTYTVTVTAANGCTATSSITITANTTPPASPSLVPSCSGSTSVLTASATASQGGTLSYAITGLTGTGGVFNTGVMAGTSYTVTVTETPSGCTATASATATACCPTLASAPPAVSITNSICSAPSCNLSGGSISAPSGTPCPAGSTLQYSTDSGATWSTTLPVYDQDGPTQTILTRCNCDLDNTQSSPTATATTALSSCAGCGCNANAGTWIH